jgi:hypothetical protein
MVRTNNTLLPTFTADNANALVNITRNNDRLTVVDGAVNHLFASPTQSGLGRASEYDNIKDCRALSVSWRFNEPWRSGGRVRQQNSDKDSWSLI